MMGAALIASDDLSVSGLFASHILLQCLRIFMSYLHISGYTSHPHSLSCCAVAALVCQYSFGPKTTLCIVCLHAVNSMLPEDLGLLGSAARVAARTVAAQVDQIVSNAHPMLVGIQARFLPATSTLSTASISPEMPKPVIPATHLTLTKPNRPNDLTESAVIGPCIMPQERPDVVTLSLSHKPAQARWSDLVVVCGKSTFEAHKVILCSQVRYYPCRIYMHPQPSFPSLEDTGSNSWRYYQPSFVRLSAVF